MSYLVLARKWRPKRFAELVGQEHVVKALTNALDSGRVHHAFLFTGTRGVGKTTIARIFAKSLNCERGTSADPCGECNSCRDIDAGRFIDLLEIDAASNTGVDDVREVIDNAQYMPSRGRVKVYLIDEVHMLSKSAFNALLKTLEEPPGHVKFLLATTDPQKLPVTVLSRCLQFNLKRLDEEQIRGQMRRILDAEQIPADDGALKQLARGADGSLRDGLSLLDQAIAYTGSQLSDAGVAAMLGTVDRGRVGMLLDALSNGDGAALMSEVERLADFSPDWNDVLDATSDALHRVQLRQLVPNAAIECEGVDVDALADALAPELVQVWYQMALNGRRDLPFAPSPRAGFEMVVLRMLAFRPNTGTGSPAGGGRGERAASTEASRGASAMAAARAALNMAPTVRAEASTAAVDTAASSRAVAVRADASPSVSNATNGDAASRSRRDVAPADDVPVSMVDTTRRQSVREIEAPSLSDEVARDTAARKIHVDADAIPASTTRAETTHSQAPTSAAFEDADAWRDWVAASPLRGPARLLAEHAGFLGCNDGVLRLSVDASDEHLKGAPILRQLADALASRLGRAPQIRFESPAQPVDSMRMQAERARDTRQAAAERDFEQHPDVRRLVAAGARIVPDSVRPLER